MTRKPENIYKKVDEIGFGMFSPEQIREMAATKIVTPELYDKEGYPVDGGLMDVRLGVIDPGLRCKTCGGRLKECPGHFGYIELARPVIHYKFVKTVQDLLRTTCRECGRVMASESAIEKYKDNIERIEEEEGIAASREYIKKVVRKLRKNDECEHCGAEQEKIKLQKPTDFTEDEETLSPIEIRARLEKIPDEDLPLFGINPEEIRPEWMVLTVLPVPSVTSRPSITLESGDRSEDDLTHKMIDVVRINQRLFENINAGAPEVIIEDLWDLLQYHVTTFFDNDVSQIPPAKHRGGQPLKTITGRIKSKEGRIRRNLAGKRTNFSARTVISPDPMMKPNEVGVPKQMATKLTIPEKVTKWNKDYLKEFIERGNDQYPGANYVIHPDGRRKKVTDETTEEILEELEPGYKVERHLMDGDITLFNRQPSLHRMSIMAHKVKVMDGKTLRLNPSVCAPYNADFDGDEMNLHIPQTEEARAEAEVLMEVHTQLVSPRYGLPIMGCIQDSITGNYILTRDIEYDFEDGISLLGSIGTTDFDSVDKDSDKLTGKEIFSALLPDDLNYYGEDEEGEKVVIENGMLKEGIIDDSAIGEQGKLLHVLKDEYGKKEAMEILNKIFRLGIRTLLKEGFTIGISDTDISEEGEEKINEVIEDAKEEAEDLIEQYRKGELQPLPGRSEDETVELKVLEVLNKARNECGEIVLEHGGETASTIMAESGARGSVINIAQTSGIVGQQSLSGKRIDQGYEDRTLSYFEKDDLGPDARGFISNSFNEGMDPAEFFFGSMTGRDSLMDTALRTPKSGYLYRRLSNALQDLKVEYDETVRDMDKKVVQFDYGEDGIDVAKSEGGTIDVERIIEEVDKE